MTKNTFNPELMDIAHNFLARACQLTLKMMAVVLSVSKVSIMSVTDLGKRKICVKFVIHSLHD
jgi:hypothetical protein